MVTAILLRSNYCLQGRLRHDDFSLTASSDKSKRFSNSNPNPKPNQNHRQKRNPMIFDADFQDRDRSRSTVVVKGPGANLVMGQVKILKRGEKLSPEPALAVADSDKEGFDLVLGSTDRLGPDPSSVPVPEFLAKKNRTATSGLRRLLRLDSV